jgi:hypothetical protein
MLDGQLVDEIPDASYSTTALDGDDEPSGGEPAQVLSTEVVIRAPLDGTYLVQVSALVGGAGEVETHRASRTGSAQAIGLHSVALAAGAEEEFGVLYSGATADVNVDGVIDTNDAAIVINSIGTERGTSEFDPLADLNNDGVVDSADLCLVGMICPAVRAMTPTSGSAAGGTVVSVTGASFSEGATCHVGDSALQDVVVAGSDLITGTAPGLVPGTLNDLSVSNADLSSGHVRNAWFADFLDVGSGHMFHDSVEGLVRAGVTAGCGAGRYCPDESVTRAQMAVFLQKAQFGTDYLPPACLGVFQDVECAPSAAFAVDWIEQLFSQGITGGCNSTPLLYCPSAPVTRAQVAVFLLKTKHGSDYSPPPCSGIFKDVVCTPGIGFPDWIEALAAEGITGGCGSGNYCPSNPVTRGQMAAFIRRALLP